MRPERSLALHEIWNAHAALLEQLVMQRGLHVADVEPGQKVRRPAFHWTELRESMVTVRKPVLTEIDMLPGMLPRPQITYCIDE